ncbi:hypothetical protein FQN54_008102 [Arachnomyces sp. PD_36]|nr:hypothetical protein FQN54_008102 [Arachnomyces sp. PD_36]
MPTDNPDTPRRLIYMIKPESPVSGVLESAKNEIFQIPSSAQSTPPVSRIAPPGPKVTALMKIYPAAFSRILSDTVTRADTDQIKVSWDIAVLEYGTLKLERVPTLVMIRLFEIGNVEAKAVDSEGSESVNWEGGDIAVISGALHLTLSPGGKLVCVCVNYETQMPP